jgi:hypothetical protein
MMVIGIRVWMLRSNTCSKLPCHERILIQLMTILYLQTRHVQSSLCLARAAFRTRYSESLEPI